MSTIMSAADSDRILRSIEIRNPKVRQVPVGHDVFEIPDIDDLTAIRRDLRIGDIFQIENVQHLHLV